ncbi:MAG: lysophospholipid acyltransferase family protein [Planctomycetota bacterium]
MKRFLPTLVYWLAWVLRHTSKVVVTNDRRGELRDAGQPYIYAALHAHKFALLMLSDPRSSPAAMVSRSGDGDLVAQALEKFGIRTIRGSSGDRKGGATALIQMVRHMRKGNAGVLTVDGPTGPRRSVNPGVALLAQKTKAPVLPLVLIPRRRLLFKKSWDRTQIPLPLSPIHTTFGDPIYPIDGESVDEFLNRVQASLEELEFRCDPEEAARTPRASVTPVQKAA